jgi:acetate kinase
MKVLLLNAGSSSLKFSLLESADEKELAHGLGDWAGEETRYHYEGPDGQEHSATVSWRGPGPAVRQALHDLTHTEPIALPRLTELAAVGHRVVHGGDFTEAVRITPEVQEKLKSLTELAPLHNPPSLETLAAAQAELPNLQHIAVFDTAFHATMPPEARTYTVPRVWTNDWKIRRYGFHGLSHAYCARRAAQMLNRPLEQLRLVICHLGHGCSATAIEGGRSIDTTMGFTPLEGLMMGTRSGSIDPAVVTYVQQQHGLSAAEVEKVLLRQSGLLGVSGVSADMREVEKAASEGNADARLALAIYTHRIRQAVGALTATLGGVDALVFTAGVGENAAKIRAEVCERLSCLGLYLDANANESRRPDADIARADSPGRILIIATREDLTMLHEVMRLVRD